MPPHPIGRPDERIGPDRKPNGAPQKSGGSGFFGGRGGAVGGGYDPPDHHEIITLNRTQVHGMVEKRRRKLMGVPV